jgi:hypothetical protein
MILFSNGHNCITYEKVNAGLLYMADVESRQTDCNWLQQQFNCAIFPHLRPPFNASFSILQQYTLYMVLFA